MGRVVALSRKLRLESRLDLAEIVQQPQDFSCDLTAESSSSRSGALRHISGMLLQSFPLRLRPVRYAMGINHLHFFLIQTRCVVYVRRKQSLTTWERLWKPIGQMLNIVKFVTSQTPEVSCEDRRLCTINRQRAMDLYSAVSFQMPRTPGGRTWHDCKP